MWNGKDILLILSVVKPICFRIWGSVVSRDGRETETYGFVFFFEAFKASSGCVRGNKDELFIFIHFEVELFVSDVGGASADITRPQSPC